jgi:metal-responsive CopG/Arc/MetJ family transcriptional regulator
MPPDGYRSVTLPVELVSQLDSVRQARQLPSFRAVVEYLLELEVREKLKGEEVGEKLVAT